MKRWIAVALRRDIVINSLKVCALVGTILISINYFDRIRSGNLSMIGYFKMLLMYCNGMVRPSLKLGFDEP